MSAFRGEANISKLVFFFLLHRLVRRPSVNAATNCGRQSKANSVAYKLSLGGTMSDNEDVSSLLEKAAEYHAKAKVATDNPALKAALEAVALEYTRMARAFQPGFPRPIGTK